MAEQRKGQKPGGRRGRKWFRKFSKSPKKHLKQLAASAQKRMAQCLGCFDDEAPGKDCGQATNTDRCVALNEEGAACAWCSRMGGDGQCVSVDDIAKFPEPVRPPRRAAREGRADSWPPRAGVHVRR